jgi:hypothetical protein
MSRAFYQRLRDDWTPLSFIIYGAMPLVLFIALNEYKNEEPYMFVALLILAAGGCLYLQRDSRLKRYLCLQAGMGLSMIVAAGGMVVLEESSLPGLCLTTDINIFRASSFSVLYTLLWLAEVSHP